MFISEAWAQAAGGAAGGGDMLMSLAPMLLIFVVFWFLLIRPQQKKQKQQEEMLKAIEKGDDVITAGGLHGKVVGTTDDVLTVEIAALKGGERIRVKVSRGKVENVQKAKKGER